MKLMNKTKNTICADNVIVAKSLVERLQGLIGRKSLAENSVMLIHNCPSIHTFFMNFAIDVVFLDRRNHVHAIYENVGPWRFAWPRWGAKSVIEFNAGAVQKAKIELGDLLSVTD